MFGSHDGTAQDGKQGQFVILGEYADLGWWGSFTALPVKPVQKITATRNLGKPSVSITSFDRNHGIFKKFQNSANFTLNTAQFYAYTEMKLNPGATALAKFEDGSPAMAEFSGKDRGLVVFASSVDNAVPSGWNDFPLKGFAFVPMFIEVARYLSHSDEVREWYALGEGVPVVGSLVGGTAAVITPERRTCSRLGELTAGEQRFFTPTVPGFHEIRVGREIRVIAVNPPSNEGNLDVIPPEDLLASVQSTAAEAQKAGLFTSDDQLEHAKRQLSWWYILLIAILAAIVEIYIANRSNRASSGTLIPGRKFRFQPIRHWEEWMKPNEELLQKIGQVRTKWKTLLWVRGLAWVLGVLVASIAVGIYLANTPKVPFWLLNVLKLAGVAALVTAVVRTLVMPLRRVPTDEQLARFVQEKNPGLEDRLVSAVEAIHKPRPDQGMFGYLVVKDALDRTRNVQFSEQVNKRQITTFAVSTGALVILLMVGLYYRVCICPMVLRD